MKKLVTPVGVVAASWLVVGAGCSYYSENGGVDYDASVGEDVVRRDSAHDRFVPPEDASTICPTNEPIDTSDEPFKTPTPAVVGACTDADFIAMEAAFEKGINTTSDLETGVSDACKACAFSQGSDATWGPVVLDTKVGTGTGDIFNPGACLALVSGNNACGETYAAIEDCTSIACDSADDPTCTGTMQQNCMSAAAQGVCDTQRQAVLTACGANIVTYLQQCDNAARGGCTTCGGTDGDVAYTFESYVVQQCVHDPRELDASVPDGG